MEFSLRGVSDMQRRLTEIERSTREELSDAAMDEARDIVMDAKDNYVPVALGTLRETIHADKGSLSQGRDTVGRYTSGSEVEIVISAGGDLPYALAIHEHPSPHDPPSWQGVNVEFHPDGRGPKFLEHPLNAAISGMVERIAGKIGSKLG